MIELLEKLPNGATIIAAKRKNDREWCVIAICESGLHRYVVWRVDPIDKSCFWGNYHKDLSDAVDYYDKI